MKISDKSAQYAFWRAWISSFGFACWTVAILAAGHHNWSLAWPLVVFYFLLLLNTFFSIKTFSSLVPPRHLGQLGMDLILGACLLLMPLTFSRPDRFTMLALILFILATFKYVLLVPVIGLSRLLYRKIKIDLLGVLFCFMALVPILAGFTRISLMAGVSAFAIANVYVLWFRPLYDLRAHSEGVARKSRHHQIGNMRQPI